MKLLGAVYNNDLELVKKLINDGCYTLNETDVFDDTALIIASRYGYYEIAKELIKAGVSITEINDYGNTALYFNKEMWQTFEIQDLILTMYPDKYKFLEENVGIHKDILLKLKMKQILSL